MRTRTRGLTLVGLMIIVAILAILAAILFPCGFQARAYGQLATCESNEKNIGTALDMYAGDNQGRYPNSTLAQLTPNYLKVIPTCPEAGSDTYSGSYAVASPKAGVNAYTFVCSGSHHQNVGISADFPQYTSSQGLVSGH